MEDSQTDDLIRDLQSLQLQVTQLQEEARARDDAHRPEQAQAAINVVPERATNGFARGDHVRVLNKFKKPAMWNNSCQRSEAKA